MNKKITNNKKKNQKGGFTLVELLATIAILAIVSVIPIYTATNLISKTKEKSYKVSISNIEQGSGSYAIENQSGIKWLPDEHDANGEYYCVTVQDLIDMGYFDNEVLNSKVDNNTKVTKGDYVYLKRNKTTKTILENKLLVGDNAHLSSIYCGDINSSGNIDFQAEPTGWSNYKNVAINYQILNLKGNSSDYQYYYLRDDTNETNIKNFSNSNATATISNFKGESIIARIYQGEEILVEETFSPKIDIKPPRIELLVENGTTWKKDNNVDIFLIDNESGFKVGTNPIHYTWSEEPLTTCDEIKQNKLETIGVSVANNNQKIVESGAWVSSQSGKGKVYVCADDTVTDYAGNNFKEIASADMYLDSDKPTISIGNYTKTDKARGSVTIDLVVKDNTSYIKTETFDKNDIEVKVGNTTINDLTLTRESELVEGEETLYKLVINNTQYDGQVSIKINNNKFTDVAENENIGLNQLLDITFKNSYIVTLHLGNATSTAGTTQIGTKTCTYGISCTLPNFSTLSNKYGNTSDWKFYGWSNNERGTSKNYNDAGSIAYNGESDNVRLYAILKKDFKFYTGIAPTYAANTISQYWNPYSTASTYLTSINLPTATNINSWRFLGYLIGSNTASSSVTYASSLVGTNVTPEYTADSNIRSVYERTLTIKYNGNEATGGSTADQVAIQYYNSGYASSGTNSGANITSPTFTLRANGFTYTGRTFQKWADGSATGTKYAAGATYSFAPAVNNTTITKYMYATWERIKVYVNYHANGGTGTMQATECSYGTDCTLRTNTFTKTGHNYIKWNTQSNGSGTNYIDKITNITSNIDLYAQWQAKTYTISYNACNHGGDMPTSQTKTYGVSIVLPTPTPSERGYKFIGWSTTGCTDTTVDYAGGATYSLEGDKTLYALWQDYYVNIKYSANGGTITDGSSSDTWSLSSNIIQKNGTALVTKIKYGETIGSSGLLNYDYSQNFTVTKSGYKVPSGSEWIYNSKTYSQANGTTYTSNDFCDASNADCTVTLNLNWEQLEPTILLADPGDGTNPATTGWTALSGRKLSYKNVTESNTYGTLPTPTRSGYSFKGWYNVTPSQTITIASSTSNYNYKTVLDDIYPGVTYTIKIGSSSVTSGSATRYSIAFYDFTTSSSIRYVTRSFSTSSDTFNLTCPSTATAGHDIRLLIYSGTSGSTANVATKFTGVIIGTMGTTVSSQYTSSSTVEHTQTHVLFAHWASSPPTCKISLLTRDRASVRATYSSTTNVVGYYFGSSQPSSSSTFTSMTAAKSGTIDSPTINSAGTYYFGFKNSDGSIGSCKAEISNKVEGDCKGAYGSDNFRFQDGTYKICGTHLNCYFHATDFNCYVLSGSGIATSDNKVGMAYCPDGYTRMKKSDGHFLGCFKNQ